MDEFISIYNDLRRKSTLDFQSNYFMTDLDIDFFIKNDDAVIVLSKEKTFYKLFYAFIYCSAVKHRRPD